MTDRPTRTSRIPGFYKLSVDERLARIQAFADLDDADLETLRGPDGRTLAKASRMIENVGGLFHLPVGFAANFRVDGEDQLLPMVIEEASVVAASSNAAKLLRGGEGIVTAASDPIMIGQIQLCDVPDVDRAVDALRDAEDRLVALANSGQPRLVARGGGARALEVRAFPDSPIGPMVVTHLLVDVRDAMGANLVNGMVEALAKDCEALSGGHAHLRILSNLADRRLVHATGRVPLSSLARPDLGLDGAEVAERVFRASVFAELDPYRAATHNKGIMNGVDAFLLAAGQDWRAIEAGVHAWAARDGRYTALATWRREGDALVGRITLPMQVGVVGGVIGVHPVVGVLLKVLGTPGATALGRLAAAVGLAQNLAAILALATEGIQRGHMSLHARNIAAAAGATGADIDRIVAEMIRRRSINTAAARTIIDERRADAVPTAPLTLDEITGIRDDHWPQVEALLRDVVASDGGADAPGGLGEMVWYQLGTGGKRLRTALPLIIYRALGGEAAQVVPFAAALELLHNATLIHDDAEDRVRTRRGEETLWVRYGLDQAINAGDGMQHIAMQCLLRLQHAPALTTSVASMASRRMVGIIDAQVRARRADRSLSAWEELTRDRTGGLFALALGGAARLAGADPPTVARLQSIGGQLGVLFQVQDELLDLLGGPGGAGRGRAIADGKMGLLLAHGLHHAPDPVRSALQGILRARDNDAAEIARAIEILQTRGSLAYAAETMSEAEQAIAEAATRLDPNHDLRRVVEGFADIVLAPLRARVGQVDAERS